ncbi:MAG: MurR/RpiR family transcriptional regulator, partial [Deltaproteobacteria bacterium]|nr:MurR/RpiR family transcriptional regulator [Deltaproteobacteria bacterium]
MPIRKPPSGGVFSAIDAELPRMPKKLRALAEHVLENWERMIFQTVRQLAAEAQVSESTIMRFSNHLGYEGYSDFQDAARDFVTAHLAVSQSVSLNGSADPLTAMTVELRENPDFVALANHLVSARKIHLLSSPDAASEAVRLKWSLSRQRPGVYLGSDDPGLAEEEIESLPDDSLIAIVTGWHSTLQLMALAERAKANKIPLFLITFNPANALAEFCENRAVVKELPDHPGLGLTVAINFLTEMTKLSTAQRHQDYRERLDRIALTHQPLSERRDTLQLAIGHELRTLDPFLNHSLMREA